MRANTIRRADGEGWTPLLYAGAWRSREDEGRAAIQAVLRSGRWTADKLKSGVVVADMTTLQPIPRVVLVERADFAEIARGRPELSDALRVVAEPCAPDFVAFVVFTGSPGAGRAVAGRMDARGAPS